MAGRFGRETRATSARVTRIMHRLERRTLPVSVRKRNPDAARATLRRRASLVSQTNLVASDNTPLSIHPRDVRVRLRSCPALHSHSTVEGGLDVMS